MIPLSAIAQALAPIMGAWGSSKSPEPCKDDQLDTFLKVVGLLILGFIAIVMFGVGSVVWFVWATW